MYFNADKNEEKIYRGGVPFYLDSRYKNKKLVYISCSDKNIEDYYYSYLNFFGNEGKKIHKFLNDSFEEREKRWKNYMIKEIIDSDEDFIIFLNIESAVSEFSKEVKKLEIESGKEYKQSEIIYFLEECGYEKNYLVTKKGEYSRRGDIIDIYPVNEDEPFRIEFFGDEVESIRKFDIETQKSFKKCTEFKIYSADENITLSSIVSLGEGKEIEYLVENPEITSYRIEEIIHKNREREENLRERYNEIYLKSIKLDIIRLDSEESIKYRDYSYVSEVAKNISVTIYSEEKGRYGEIFQNENIAVERYPHYEGFKTEKELVLTDRELKGTVIKHYEKRKEKLKYSNINQIKKDDFVIHEMYGVGIYRGLESIAGKDYLRIKYADEDNLYVPVEHIDRIERYITEPGKVPVIYNIGKKGFKTKKRRYKKI